MQTALPTHVAAANQLTARWCAAAGTGDFVVSGCGVWPLLAVLAGSAAGPARAELAAATGVAAGDGIAAALRMWQELDAAQGISAALGVWHRADLPIRPEWVSTLPPDTVGALTDQAALDAWASRHTDGLIDAFPLQLTPIMRLVLATALLAKTGWRKPFQDNVLEPSDGPWRGHRGPGLARFTSDLGDVALLPAAEPVTRAIVRGDNDLDVHLLLGPGSPTDLLTTGFAALDGSLPLGPQLRPGTTGPGLCVREVTATGNSVELQLPPFELKKHHDLLAHADLFGLRAATDSGTGHFPAISPEPLAVSQAAQEVRARFHATGFEAAAVTAIGLTRAMMALPRTALSVEVTVDRPFGFLAVHRPTGTVIVAGWIAEPPAE